MLEGALRRRPAAVVSSGDGRPPGRQKLVKSSLGKFPRQIHSCPQSAEIMAPRNLNSSELSQMGREPLRIKQYEFAKAQMFYQRNERNFGRVCYPMKHGFAKKCATDRDAIKTSGEHVSLPSFD
jgi:hypothetical protein